MAERIKKLLRVLFAIIRYITAVFVAFMASIATLMYLPDVPQAWDPNGDSLFWFFVRLICIGLAGVTAGSFCLPYSDRWIGSLSLLFLGLIFTSCTMPADILPLTSLATGGIVPVVIQFLRWTKRTGLDGKMKLTGKETLALALSIIFLGMIIILYSLFFSWTHPDQYDSD